MNQTSQPSTGAGLSPWEQALIDFFLQVAQFLGLPKSVGQIFGLLFASDQPLSLDDIADRLQISRGSASQGLNYLRRFDAVRTTFVLGDRREFYQVETDTDRIVHGFLADQVDPDIQSWGERLRFGRQMLKIAGPAAGTDPAFADARLAVLENWLQNIAHAVSLMRNHFHRPPNSGGGPPSPSGASRPPE
jgi:HTH-type transcriptional regulator, glycine betaine synthesis regulator